METLIDTLKAMQKVTCTELAASLGIEPAEAIKMLREYEELEKLCRLMVTGLFQNDKRA
ncbi:hypothetical protein ACLB1S_11590 [Escherichia coli]